MAKQFLQTININSINVLEIGAGKGAFKNYLKQDDHYVGLEFSNDAIQLAKENNVILQAEMIEAYSLKHPNSYDVVCSFQVLEHVSNPKSFIESSLRVLKPNGILIIAVPNEDGFIKNCVNNPYNMPPHHVTRYPKKTLTNLAQIFNLELLKIEEDTLAANHIYSATVAKTQKIFFAPKLIDLSLKRSLCGLPLKFFCKIYSIIQKIRMKIFNKKTISSNLGHTTIAFYRLP